MWSRHAEKLDGKEWWDLAHDGVVGKVVFRMRLLKLLAHKVRAQSGVANAACLKCSVGRLLVYLSHPWEERP